ncbi:MAG: hypothetical protein K6G15_05945 [Desulfovibrio sp.]|nr:hypothetical protein [Desulfovibrio sp.]
MKVQDMLTEPQLGLEKASQEPLLAQPSVEEQALFAEAYSQTPRDGGDQEGEKWSLPGHEAEPFFEENKNSCQSGQCRLTPTTEKSSALGSEVLEEASTGDKPSSRGSHPTAKGHDQRNVETLAGQRPFPNDGEKMNVSLPKNGSEEDLLASQTKLSEHADNTGKPLSTLKRESRSKQPSAQSHKELDLTSQTSDSSSTNPPSALPTTNSLLESLFSQHMLQTKTVEPAPASEALSYQAMDKLVERILVAEPSQGAQEVRITLADGVLQGAELSILRTAEGQLNIQVLCQDLSAFQTAVTARQSLVEALEEHGERVNVVVSHQDSASGNESDTRRRSRGLSVMAEHPDTV